MRKLMLAMTALVVALVLTVGPAAAQTTTTPFVDKKAGCAIVDPGTQWTSGNVVHLRNRSGVSRVVNLQGMPGFDGWMTETVNYNVNLLTLKGVAWGTFNRGFDEIDGTFEGHYAGPITDGLFAGKGEAVGTGSLAGLQLKADSQQVPLAYLPGGDPCPDGALGPLGQIMTGVVRDPGGQ